MVVLELLAVEENCILVGSFVQGDLVLVEVSGDETD